MARKKRKQLRIVRKPKRRTKKNTRNLLKRFSDYEKWDMTHEINFAYGEYEKRKIDEGIDNCQNIDEALQLIHEIEI